VLGVFKAYSTRVGNGPFPSEFRDSDTGEGSLAEFVRETGNEYGVTTGRARRCGYLDLVALRYACRVNSIDSLVMTHLDVYDTLDEVKVCAAYDIDGTRTENFPAAIDALERARPALTTFAGWKQSTSGAASFDALPPAARDYIKYIEDFCACPVGIVSVGSERNQTFIRTPVWGG
jgi:adenylosuccinate synthase